MTPLTFKNITKRLWSLNYITTKKFFLFFCKEANRNFSPFSKKNSIKSMTFVYFSRDESDRSLDDGEEEFYYNEIEVPMVVKNKHNSINNNNNTTANTTAAAIKGAIKGAIKTNSVVRGQGNEHGIVSRPVVRPITHPHLTMHPGVMAVQPLAISRVSTVSGPSVSYVLSGEQVWKATIIFVARSCQYSVIYFLQKRVQLSIEGSHVTLRNLADHMDMARPPHENPEYLVKTQTYR